MEVNDITAVIVDSAIKVHTALGQGLLESACEACRIHEPSSRGLRVRRQVELPVQYDGITVDVGDRLDLLVEDTVIVEPKAVDEIAPIHKAQLLTCLKLYKKRIGLLLNFNVERMKDGITRMANEQQPLRFPLCSP
jgi:GxxExxY protein